jgi:ribulose-5-phosphate 4-epimerase/fuculose-1-phosphate aldolase
MVPLDYLTPNFTPPSLDHVSVAGEFAGLLRALHAEGYDDHLAGHVTLALDDGTFLINPWELTWDETREEDLVVMDSEGEKVSGPYNVTPAVELHVALRQLRPELKVIVHNHPRWANIWSAAHEIPPIYDQTSAQVPHELKLINEYDGTVAGRAAAEACAESFGDAEWALLANHGVLITAPTIADVYVRCITLEWRSRRAWEMRAMNGGVPLHADVADAFGRLFESQGTNRWWQAALRRHLK